MNNLIKEYNESIEWNDLKLAYSYFKFSQNGLSVAIDKTDKIWFRFWHFLNYIFFGYLLFFDLTLIFYLPSINAPSFEELLKLVLLLLSTVVIVNLFFTWLIINIDSLNTPYQRAIKINKLINNNQ